MRQNNETLKTSQRQLLPCASYAVYVGGGTSTLKLARHKAYQKGPHTGCTESHAAVRAKMGMRVVLELVLRRDCQRIRRQSGTRHGY